MFSKIIVTGFGLGEFTNSLLKDKLSPKKFMLWLTSDLLCPHFRNIHGIDNFEKNSKLTGSSPFPWSKVEENLNWDWVLLLRYLQFSNFTRDDFIVVLITIVYFSEVVSFTASVLSYKNITKTFVKWDLFVCLQSGLRRSERRLRTDC